MSSLTPTFRAQSLGCNKRYRHVMTPYWVATLNIFCLSAFRTIVLALVIAYSLISVCPISIPESLHAHFKCFKLLTWLVTSFISLIFCSHLSQIPRPPFFKVSSNSAPYLQLTRIDSCCNSANYARLHFLNFFCSVKNVLHISSKSSLACCSESKVLDIAFASKRVWNSHTLFADCISCLLY